MIPGPFSRAWGYVATAASAIGAALWFWLSAKAAGKREAINDALGRNLENVETRHAVDRAVARDPDPAGKLRADWSRD